MSLLKCRKCKNEVLPYLREIPIGVSFSYHKGYCPKCGTEFSESELDIAGYNDFTKSQLKHGDKEPSPQIPITNFALICSICGKDTVVPFTPIAGRPIYCQECIDNYRDRKRTVTINKLPQNSVVNNQIWNHTEGEKQANIKPEKTSFPTLNKRNHVRELRNKGTIYSNKVIKEQFKGFIYAVLCFVLIGLYIAYTYGISDISSINISWLSKVGSGDVTNYYYGKANDFLSFITNWGWIVIKYIPIPMISLTTQYNVLFIEKLFGFVIGLLVLFAIILNYKKTSIVVFLLLVAVFLGSFEYERCTTRNFQNRNELVTFLSKDRTDTLTYTTDFNCEDFSRTLMQSANNASYRIYFYTIPNHALCKAYLVDEGVWVQIEPQTDAIKIVGS